jgi:hypothetical protein
MPNRDIINRAGFGEYYHLDTHCNGGSHIYLDEADYSFFLLVLKKYLLDNGSVEILAYCLDQDYFDLLLFQT